MLNFQVIDFLKISQDENDENLFEAMLAIYEKDASLKMSEIERAFAGGDMPLLHELLHGLSSTSASIGATAVMDACQSISAKAKKATDAEFKKLRATLAKTMIALGELKK